MKKFTPENITELKENEIFVFGSNMIGNHAGGAARLAVEKFGAINGQAEGLQGQSYAIPTLDKDMQKLPIGNIETSINVLIGYAKGSPELTFYVTKIGCGIAGFKISEIVPIFKKRNFPLNIVLPQEFCVIKGYKAFNKDLTCRGFQYEIGKTYKQESSPIACDTGFHFCEKLVDCFEYYFYDKTRTRIAEIQCLGTTNTDDGRKFATDEIRIIRELNWDDIDNIVNTGAGNSGFGNSGDINSGDMNSGHRNSGDMNSGHRNSGYGNSGDMNSGHRNSGHRNSGDMNSGDMNSGYRNSGVFCNRKKEDKVIIFNKESNMTWNDWYNNPAYRISSNLITTEWIGWDNMTDYEKKEHPKAFVSEGYLKVYEYKEAWTNLWKGLTTKQRQYFTDLPNFDASVFEDITGIRI